MNDPVINNLGRTIGMRMLMIPVIFVAVFLVFGVLGLAMVLIASVAGDGEMAGCLMLLVFVGTLFGIFASSIGLAFYLRSRNLGKFNQSFGWLGKASSYLLRGRQYNGTIQDRNVNLRIIGRSRGMGLAADIITSANAGHHSFAIGTRSGVAGWIQGMTQSYEVTGVGLDDTNFALNSTAEFEAEARNWISSPANLEMVQKMMQHESSYEVRSIRVHGNQVSFHIRHPGGLFFQPKANREIVENLVAIAQSFGDVAKNENDSRESVNANAFAESSVMSNVELVQD